MFTYDKTKKYIFTEDMNDIENFIGCRIPLFLKMPMFKKDDIFFILNGLSEETVILRISKFLYFTCVFENVWRANGATDCRTLPIRNGVFVFTALKGDVVLKQTELNIL
jgi:hypothetical protein